YLPEHLISIHGFSTDREPPYTDQAFAHIVTKLPATGWIFHNSPLVLRAPKQNSLPPQRKNCFLVKLWNEDQNFSGPVKKGEKSFPMIKKNITAFLPYPLRNLSLVFQY